MSDTHFFRYLQVRNYIRTNILDFQLIPISCELYKLFNLKPDSKRLVSKFVDFFTSHNPISTIHLKEAWEKDLNLTINNNMWESCLKNVFLCAINSRHQLIQFKVLYRIHYSCTKLSSFYPSFSPICPKCKSAEGTLGHLFWSCSKLNKFWFDVFDCFSEIYDYSFVPNPAIAVLGIDQHLNRMSCLQCKTIQYGMIVAKRNILSLWKSENTPSFHGWLQEMISLLHIERIRYNISLNSATFKKNLETIFILSFKNNVNPVLCGLLKVKCFNF